MDDATLCTWLPPAAAAAGLPRSPNGALCRDDWLGVQCVLTKFLIQTCSAPASPFQCLRASCGRALAPAWQRLHSLHISYTALPATAHLDLDAFSEMRALENLSLYCSPDAALDQHNNQKVCTDGQGVGGGLLLN